MPAQINFPPITQGDTWGALFTLVRPDGSAIDLTGCKAHIQFRSAYHQVIYADLSSDGSGLVVDPTAGTIQLSMTPRQTASLLMRDLLYDLDLTWADGTNETLFSGQVRVIFQITELEPEYYIPSLDLTNIDNVSSFLGLFGSYVYAAPEVLPEIPAIDLTDINSSIFGVLFLTANAAPVAVPVTDLTTVDGVSIFISALYGSAAPPQGTVPVVDLTSINSSSYVGLLVRA